MTTEIAAIAAISANSTSFLAPTDAFMGTNNISNAAGQNFGAMLVSGIKNLDKSVKLADAAVTDFALGADLPPHQVMLAMENARMQLQFALQVRSRLVEGYQELMRMQL